MGDQVKSFEIKGQITNGNVSLTSLTYDNKNLTEIIKNIDANQSPINLTEEQTNSIKSALKTTPGGKSKKSYKKRKPKRNTIRRYKK